MAVCIGLTGGIASGKSTVSKTLVELGADYMDADLVGHQIYLPDKDAWRDLVAAWGEDLLMPDRTINRQKLGAIVFSDPKELERLNRITHPRIKAELAVEIDKRKSGGDSYKPFVVEAAILIEAKWDILFDKIWVVVAPPEIAIERLAESKNMPPNQAKARIDAQLSNDKRIKYADVVIENTGSLDEMRKQVEAAWSRLQS